MEEMLWKLIQDEAEAIAGYLNTINTDEAKEAENAPLVRIFRKIISDERDHLDALKYLYESRTRNRLVNDITMAAKNAIESYNELEKIAKQKADKEA